ncbi:glycosyltransferase [Xanthobacter autotrophicus]|uniref:glycosyltransferase n=1 Tax=Xanthobacter autotrophicus TaxID=280 RepID=UPI003727AA08
MKILHVCESIPGGTGSYLTELLPHQIETYGASNVMLLVPEGQTGFLGEKVQALDLSVCTFRRPGRLVGSLLLSRAYLKTVREFQPDVVHAHSSIAGLVVRLLGVARSHAIVFCPHGWSMDMKGARYVPQVAAQIERMLALAADEIILISRHEFDRALEIDVPKTKLRLVLSGIEPPRPEIPAAPWPDSRLRVLFAGRFDYQKGVDILLEAVSGLEKQFSVRLVGGYVLSEQELPGPLEPHVTNIGWLEREGVYSQMKSCDVLVIPSRWEGFGLVAIEALSLGVPVVAAAVGGLREILDDGRYGLVVPPEDPEALRAALLSLDANIRARLSAMGRMRFESAYSGERMVREIDAVYAEALAQREKVCTPGRSRRQGVL